MKTLDRRQGRRRQGQVDPVQTRQETETPLWSGPSFGWALGTGMGFGFRNSKQLGWALGTAFSWVEGRQFARSAVGQRTEQLEALVAAHTDVTVPAARWLGRRLPDTRERREAGLCAIGVDADSAAERPAGRVWGGDGLRIHSGGGG